MSLDGSVEEYLCHIQSRKPSASPYIHIDEWPVTQEKDDPRI